MVHEMMATEDYVEGVHLILNMASKLYACETKVHTSRLALHIQVHIFGMQSGIQKHLNNWKYDRRDLGHAVGLSHPKCWPHLFDPSIPVCLTDFTNGFLHSRREGDKKQRENIINHRLQSSVNIALLVWFM